jgi:hypothetical protein
MPCAAWRHRCQIPDVRAGRPALPSFPWFPSGRIPSSVVRDFYCLSAAAHKAFPREVQDSLAIHRTSVVYPLCMAAFHRAMHRFVHSSWGLRLGTTAGNCVRAEADFGPADSVRRGRSEGSGRGWTHQLRKEGSRCRQTPSRRARTARRRRSRPGTATGPGFARSPRLLAWQVSSPRPASPTPCQDPRTQHRPSRARARARAAPVLAAPVPVSPARASHPAQAAQAAAACRARLRHRAAPGPAR